MEKLTIFSAWRGVGAIAESAPCGAGELQRSGHGASCGASDPTPAPSACGAGE